MSSLYFCHHCNRSVRLSNSDLICGSCGSDFIEEIAVPSPFAIPRAEIFPSGIPHIPHIHPFLHRAEHAPRNPAPSAPPAPRRSRSFPRTSRVEREAALRRRVGRELHIIIIERLSRQNLANLQRAGPESAPPGGDGGPPPQAQPSILQHILNLLPGLQRPQQQEAPQQDAPPQDAGAQQQRPQPGRMPNVRVRLDGNGQPIAEGMRPEDFGPQFLRQLLAGAIGAQPEGIRIEVHVDGQQSGQGINPGDFVNGMDMDQILNNLMMQFGDGHQPENLTEEQLQRIPIVKVDQSHVDNKTQCSTCFDYFSLDEDVARLNCSHIFHVDCVKPWLRTHNTCPMCRAQVDPTAWTSHGGRNRPEEAIPVPPRAPPGMIDADELD